MTSDLLTWKDSIGRVPLLTAAEEITLGTMVREWQDWPDGPEAAPKLVQRRGKRAHDRMVSANLRLVTSFATKKCKYLVEQGLAVEDLISEGSLGLMKAVYKFDPAKGYKFSTYAYWWIRQAITRWASTSGKLIYTPSGHAQTLRDAKAAGVRLMHELRRQPTTTEIAKAIDITPEWLEFIMVASFRPTSLDLQICEDGTLLDTQFPTANDTLEQVSPERGHLLWKRMLRLEVDHRILVSVLYGLFGLPILPDEEVMSKAGINKNDLTRLKHYVMTVLRRKDGQYVQPSRRTKPLASLDRLRDAVSMMLPAWFFAPIDDGSGCNLPIVVDKSQVDLKGSDTTSGTIKGDRLPYVLPHEASNDVTQLVIGQSLDVPDMPLKLELGRQTDFGSQPRSFSHAA